MYKSIAKLKTYREYILPTFYVYIGAQSYKECSNCPVTELLGQSMHHH